MLVDKSNLIELSINEYNSLRFASSKNERIDQRDYQHPIESIMYAAIHTRSNIVFVVERLSQYLANLAKYHEQALKALL